MRKRIILSVVFLFISCCPSQTFSAALDERLMACHPANGEFLCASSSECISSIQVCDGHRDCSDGSDEFSDCEKSCKRVNCEHSCTPNKSPEKDGTCYCRAGFHISGPKLDKCSPLDVCTWATCSQRCQDVAGNASCSCMEGFDLASNNSTCSPKDPDIKILFAVKSSIKVLSLVNGLSTEVVKNKQGQPVGVTFDAARKLVYWTDVTDQNEAIYRSNIDGTDQKTIVDMGLVLAEGIAFDWVAGNIYFTDSNLTHVGVCDKDGKSCTVVVQLQTLDKPREIVLQPSEGRMFWTDWGTTPAIYRAGMDGALAHAIVTDELTWPNGLAIDLGNPRLYWVDAKDDTIETCDLEGDDRRVIKTTGIRHPFSMDIFGDTLYWSDWQLQQIQSCDKFFGKKHAVVYSDSREKVNGVAVLHPAAQPQSTNHCLHSKCSHICVLTALRSFRCLCPVGMILDRKNKTTCKDDPGKAKLFITEGKTIKQLHFHSIGNNMVQAHDKAGALDGLHTIGSIAYNPLNKTFILYDTFRKFLVVYNATSGKIDPLVQRHLEAVRGIDIEPVSQNLYWVDAGKQTVEVMSLRNNARAILYSADGFKPFDIIAVPEVKSIFFALVGRREGKIMRMSMDGTHINLVAVLQNGEPTSLAYHHEFGHIFWCDPVKGTIEHANIDGTSRYLALSKLEAPFSVAVHGNRVYWTDRTTPYLMSAIIGMQDPVQDSPLYIGESDFGSLDKANSAKFLATVGIIDPDRMNQLKDLTDSHRCSEKNGFGGCSHICTLAPEGNAAVCFCPDDMSLSPDDNTTCVPLKTCHAFTCDDGTCISEESRCDIFEDCAGGEDERNCTQGTCRATDFVCRGDKKCISGAWNCDGEKDCDDGSDEEGCPKASCPGDLDFQCKLGRCIPLSWKCDHVQDCPDTDDSDEQGCNFSCEPGQFKCGVQGGQECISMDWVCDGEADCQDGSDEHEHCFNECRRDEYRCMNHHCIRQRAVCNGVDDCDDNSDEIDCGIPVGISSRASQSDNNNNNNKNGTATLSPTSPRSDDKCPLDKYWCYSGECIDFEKVCNRDIDCLDGSDEGEECDNTKSCGVAHECSHQCKRTPQGQRCLCPAGFSLSKENMKSCEDVDECTADKNVCGHYCQNVKGSFKCTCHDEYVLKSDHRTCKAKGNSALVAYAAKSLVYVATYNMTLQKQITVPSPSSLSGLIDVDVRNKNVYWTSSRRGNIGVTNYDTGLSQVLIKNLSSPGLIAYDWLSNNAIVVTSTAAGRESKRKLLIKICSLRSKDESKRACAILYTLQGHEITSIGIAPQENYVFWTAITYNDFDTKSGAVYRGSMDGTGTFNLASDKVINPTGLAVDDVFKRVFWIDASTRKVEAANFDGKGRTVIISSGVSGNVNGLSVFENWVMWSDDGKSIRCRMDMQQEKPACVHEKIQNATDARYLVLLQQSLQPTVPDPCKNNSCSYICTGKVKGASFLPHTIPYTCFCPEGYENKDKQSAVCVKETIHHPTATVISPRGRSEKPSGRAAAGDDGSDDISGGVADEARSAIPADDGTSYTAVVLTSFFLILLVIFLVGGFVWYRKNGGAPPKIQVRPYVQTWVKYVNDPMQRWRDNRREPLTNAYEEVYQAGGGSSSGTFENPLYEEVGGKTDMKRSEEGGGNMPRSLADSGIMTLMDNDPACPYSDDDMQDGHYISYSQKDCLIDKEFA